VLWESESGVATRKSRSIPLDNRDTGASHLAGRAIRMGGKKMHHFDDGHQMRSAHSDRQLRRGKLSGGDESAAGQHRQTGQESSAQLNGHQDHAVSLGSHELTQSLGRAQRHASRRAPSSRDLPGLMPRPVLASVRASGSALPGPRRPLDDQPTDFRAHADSANGEVYSANGHRIWLDGYLTPRGRKHNGTPVRGDDAASALADGDYRTIAAGMAIAPRITVVLPVMNEAANLPGVFATLPAWVDELVLVDGQSTDDTVEVARRLRPDVKVVLQGGVGKGDALAAGFAAATGDIIVAIDGDGSTDGNEIVRFVSALLSGADFAKGSRFNSAGRSDDITAIRRYGNKMLNVTVNRLFGTNFSDLCYGYNAFWSKHLDKLALDSPGFEIETLMSIRAARAGLKIYEVPSHERLRQHGSSNLSAVKDGWRILRLIAQEKKEASRRKVRRPKPFMAPGRLASDDELLAGQAGQ
jgi:Glycosyl transferase family 2